jgi:hypothetical protein
VSRREKDGHVTRNVAEIDVTESGYEAVFYDSNKKNAAELLSIVVNAKHGGDRRKFFEDVLGCSSNAQLGNMIGVPLFNHIAPSVYQTNVVDFITQGKSGEVTGKGTNRLKEFLSQAHVLCKPFWKVRNVGDAMFEPVSTISVKHTEIEQGGKPLPPKVIDDWRKGRDFEAIPYEASHEIVLTQKVYGARAFYLEDAKIWKKSFDERLRRIKEITKNKKTDEFAFMMESHITFRDIPDIFPEEDILPLRSFALALAYGFIVRRGDWYHMSLEKERTATGDEIIRVLYSAEEKHGLTVHHIAKEREFSFTGKVGAISFERPKERIDKKRHLLAQGRENAFEAFKSNQDFIDLVKESANIFLEETGIKNVRLLLDEYCAKVLDPSCEEGCIFEKEKGALMDYISSIGK